MPQTPEESLWLYCYRTILQSEPWWRSDKKIRELSLIMTLEILDKRLQTIEKLLTPSSNE